MYFSFFFTLMAFESFYKTYLCTINFFKLLNCYEKKNFNSIDIGSGYVDPI